MRVLAKSRKRLPEGLIGYQRNIKSKGRKTNYEKAKLTTSTRIVLCINHFR
jgi:hypothetical protein